MKKILLIGDESKTTPLKELFDKKNVSVEISDGDFEEDFKDFDVLFDLNFDDDAENFPIYAGLKDKVIFLSTVKQSLSESNYIFPSKVRSKLFGINAIPHYLTRDYWEISLFRGNEADDAKNYLTSLAIPHIIVDDSVGLYRPRTEFLALNEKIQMIENGLIPNYLQYDFLVSELKLIDEIGVTTIFETLMAIYEDTQNPKYLPSTLLKKKYLRNHLFLR